MVTNKNGFFPILITLAIVVQACTISEREGKGETSDGLYVALGSVAAKSTGFEASGSDWITTGGALSESRYSQLSHINRDTVQTLGFAWDYHTGTYRGMEATPVVVNGVMFFSGAWGSVYALDAANGEELWIFKPNVDGQIAANTCCDYVNRGVAVWDGLVYVAALDATLYALDATSGKVVWRAETIDEDNFRQYSSTGAPRVAGDVVVIGNAGADFNARGYFGGYDLKTGERKWRFYTVPAAPDQPYEHAELEMAATTWDPNSRFDLGGGGTVWDSMVYDRELDLLYVGTGNAAIYPQSERSPEGGDNLFLSSILAIKPASGELVWHYQTTPGESWDYTSTQNMILAEQMVEGALRKVLYQAPKNGFFYVLDRVTGELISAEPFAPVNWASHIDLESGRPVLTEDAIYFNDPKVIFPAAKGAHGWRPMAYSERTGLVYIPVYEDAELMVNLHPNGYIYREGVPAGGMINIPLIESAVDAFAAIVPYDIEMLKSKVRNHKAPPRRAVLRAWDPEKQTSPWEVELASFRNGGGVLATAGGLVFHSTAAGYLEIYNDESGELLYKLETGSGLMAAPVSYEIDGEQYIAVLAGLGGGGHFTYARDSAAFKYGNQGRLLTFKLGGGKTPLPDEVSWPEFPEPPPLTADAQTVASGMELFVWNCYACHRNAGPGLNPDLRMLGKRHSAFDVIVRQGALVSNGMPNFSERLSKEETDSIQAFLIAQAWQAYGKPSKKDEEEVYDSGH